MKLLKLIFLLVIAVGLFSCSKSSNKLAESIPVGAQSVTYIDMEAIIKKSNYNIFENPTVQRGINMLKAFMKDEEAVKLLENFQKNSNVLGVTFNKDMFFFTKDESYGFILPVNDAKKFKESIMKFGVNPGVIKEEKGTYSISQSAEVSIVWNSDKLLVLVQVPGLEEDTTQQLSAAKLLVQDKKESILSDKNFDKFLKDKKDISSYSSVEAYKKFISKLELIGTYDSTQTQKTNDIAQSMTKLIDEYKGVSAGTFVSFEKGKIEVESKSYFETADAEAKVKKMMTETSGEISDKYLQYIAQSPIISLVGNVKGSGCYALLEKTGILKAYATELKETKIDFKGLLESINGNFVFTLNELTLEPKKANSNDMDAMLEMQDNSPKPKYKLSFFYELAQNNKIGGLLDSLVAKEASEVAKKGADGQYTIKNSLFEGYFGVKNNTLYFTTESSIVPSIGTSAKSPYYDKAKGKSAYAYGDFRPLKTFLLNLYDQEGGNAQSRQLISDGLSLLETFEGYCKQDFSNKGIIHFTNKKDNSLASIFKYLDTVLTTIGAQRGI